MDLFEYGCMALQIVKEEQFGKNLIDEMMAHVKSKFELTSRILYNNDSDTISQVSTSHTIMSQSLGSPADLEFDFNKNETLTLEKIICNGFKEIRVHNSLFPTPEALIKKIKSQMGGARNDFNYEKIKLHSTDKLHHWTLESKEDLEDYFQFLKTSRWVCDLKSGGNQKICVFKTIDSSGMYEAIVLKISFEDSIITMSYGGGEPYEFTAI